MRNPPPSSDRPTPVLTEFDPRAIYMEARMRNKLRREEERRIAEAQKLAALLDKYRD